MVACAGGAQCCATLPFGRPHVCSKEIIRSDDDSGAAPAARDLWPPRPQWDWAAEQEVNWLDGFVEESESRPSNFVAVVLVSRGDA